MLRAFLSSPANGQSSAWRWATLPLVLLAAAALGLPLAQAQLPIPQLSTISPPGAKVGTSVDVKVAGVDLDDLASLQFSHPGITAAPKMMEGMNKPIAGEFSVKIAGDVPPGVYEVRGMGRFGLSSPRGFAVGTGNEVLEAAGNEDPAKAMELPLGSTVNGKVDAAKLDYYKIPLKAGQHVVIDVVAERIDSRLDATLALFDPNGREIRRVRDTRGKDPVIEFTATADGNYAVGIYDFLYGGGNEHFYRLSADGSPLIDFVFPPVGVAGSNANYTVYGRNLPGGQPVAGMTLDGSPLQQLNVQIPLPAEATAPAAGSSLRLSPHLALSPYFEYRLTSPQGLSSGAPIFFSSAAPTAEKEPNNEPAQAQVVSIPAEIVGQFFPAADSDWFSFEGKKGQDLFLEVRSHRLGRDTDPVMIIQKVKKNEKGEEVVTSVADVDDSAERQQKIGGPFDITTDDPSYRLKIDEDATYRILVRDQFGDSRSEPRSVYVLSVRPPQPDFSLLAFSEPMKDQNQQKADVYVPVLRKGGTTSLNLAAVRRDGFEGDIQVTVEGLPPGITCSGATLGGSVDSGGLVFTAADNAAAWSGTIKVVGKAMVNGKEVVREVRGAQMIWGSANTQQNPVVARVTRNIALSVIDKESAPALVQVGEDKVYETFRGGKLDIPIKVTRRDGFAEALKLNAVGLPNDFKPKEVNVAAGEGKLELDLGGKVNAGVYTFYLASPAKMKYSRNPDAVKNAEEDKKAFDAMVTDLTAKAKVAADAKTAATKAATDADAALKKAQADKAAADKGLADAKDDAQKKAAQEKVDVATKAVAEADGKLKAANDAKTASEAADKEATDKLKKTTDMQKAAEKAIADAKTASTPKDVNFFVTSTPIRLRVAESPLKLNLPAKFGPVKQGEKLEVMVAVEKLFGYDDAIEVSLEPAPGVNGLTANKLTIAKGQAAGKLEVQAAAAAPAGDQAVTLRFRVKAGNANLDTIHNAMLQVTPK